MDLYAIVIAQEKAKLKKGENSDAMDTDSDSSHEMAGVKYDSDHNREYSKVSLEELDFLAKLYQDEDDALSNKTTWYP